MKNLQFLSYLLIMLLFTFTIYSYDNNSGTLDAKIEDKTVANVRDQVVEIFNLDVKSLRPLSLNDIFNNKNTVVSKETKHRVIKAYNTVLEVGDFMPIIFLKENDKVLIAVKHPNNSITLTEFDISNEYPVLVYQKVRQAEVIK